MRSDGVRRVWIARRGLLSLAGLAAALAACSPGGHAPASAQAVDTPSGLPIPRYVTLKSDPVKARAGPSDDHRVLWAFHVRGLPVQVVAETQDWRRICDPEGGLSWVNKLVTDGRRSVMRTQPGDAPILSAPRDDAAPVAYLAHQALASLDRCDGDWCRVRVGAIKGWLRGTAVWGVEPAPQCH